MKGKALRGALGSLIAGLRRLPRRTRHELELISSWQFARDIGRLIAEYKWYSLSIFIVTVFQEFAALWPVTLLGQFIDRLGTGDLGNIVWIFLFASVAYPGLARANVILRHKMFYETDFEKMAELVLKVSDRGVTSDPEAVGAAYTRAANAVSGITNATYHILGSFTPVIIKIIIVSASLLAYNRLLGFTYLGSLFIPSIMTILFNRLLRVLLDSQYSIVSQTSGAGIRAINERGTPQARARFLDVLSTRKRILLTLIFKNQTYLYIREAALVGSQFLVVFLALGMRAQLNMTPGDFARVIGYTAQVAAAFISAASSLDAIISYSRAYHIFAQGFSELGISMASPPPSAADDSYSI